MRFWFRSKTPEVEKKIMKQEEFTGDPLPFDESLPLTRAEAGTVFTNMGYYGGNHVFNGMLYTDEIYQRRRQLRFELETDSERRFYELAEQFAWRRSDHKYQRDHVDIRGQDGHRWRIWTHTITGNIHGRDKHGHEMAYCVNLKTDRWTSCWDLYIVQLMLITGDLDRLYKYANEMP